MSGHTPGPWQIGPMHRAIRPSFNSPGENGSFAICYMYVDGKDHVANAKLIAASPDLLSVAIELEESSAYWSEYDVPLGIVDRLRAAIAKAKGEMTDE